jgi:hypothetical protein
VEYSGCGESPAPANRVESSKIRWIASAFAKASAVAKAMADETADKSSLRARVPNRFSQ